jgi:hypothetical protein
VLPLSPSHSPYSLWYQSSWCCHLPRRILLTRIATVRVGAATCPLTRIATRRVGAATWPFAAPLLVLLPGELFPPLAPSPSPYSYCYQANWCCHLPLRSPLTRIATRRIVSATCLVAFPLFVLLPGESSWLATATENAPPPPQFSRFHKFDMI